jgi:hypothetical protein
MIELQARINQLSAASLKEQTQQQQQAPQTSMSTTPGPFGDLTKRTI